MMSGIELGHLRYRHFIVAKDEGYNKPPRKHFINLWIEKICYVKVEVIGTANSFWKEVKYIH